MCNINQLSADAFINKATLWLIKVIFWPAINIKSDLVIYDLFGKRLIMNFDNITKNAISFFNIIIF